jgi:hypothetical protein
MQATIQRELTRIHTPATLTIGHVSPDAVHLMVCCMRHGQDAAYSTSCVLFHMPADATAIFKSNTGAM